jgi:putative FmdB family regulatory protein
MPIYEYLCGECGHRLDALQKLSDEPLVHCPHCAAPSLKRQMSAPSFRLKGGGWYETDFKNDKRRNIAESESKGDGKAEGKTEKADAKSDKPDGKPADGKSESKGESKGESKSADKPAAKPAATTGTDKPAVKKPDAGKAGGVA